MSTIKTNLNYFLSLFIAGSMLALWLAAPFLAIILVSIGAGVESIIWSQLLLVAMVFVVLLSVWKKYGALSPDAVKPGTESRYRIGNVILVIANTIVGLSLLVSIVGFYFVNGFGIAIGFIIAGALLLAVPANIVGIICVETSRLRRAAISVSSKT